MTVDSVKIENFRNLMSAELVPDNSVNVIFGQNAQGKTNILEALWLFTGCKSFKGAKDSELINCNSEYVKNKLKFSCLNRQKEAEIIIGEKKKAFLNGIELKSTTELIGEFYSVIFSPAHLSLIKDGPSQRRNFLDIALCQLKPKYAGYLKGLSRSLKQRNALLKDIQYNSGLYDILDSWDDQLARYSAAVISERLKYILSISSYCEEIYSGISENKEKFSMKYVSCGDFSPDMSIGDIYLLLLENIKNSRKTDLMFKTTSVGPHRDDLEILINNMSARNYGSQGQQRSCALALKLGESEIIKTTTGETPVALLDDVMSELDEKRQDYVLNHIKERQVFLTCCDPSQVLRMCGGKAFNVENGRISEK